MSNYLAGPYKTNDGNAPNVQAVPAGFVYAGPLAGNPAVPTFRLITTSDLPTGSVTFTGLTLTPNGSAYADTTSSIKTTAAGAQYQTLTANATGTAPSFQALNLSQSAATTGSLPVASGGTGTTTSTGTGSNVLSNSPTLTGTLAAGTLTLTTPLAAANGGTGATANTGTGNNVLSASPTFTGTIAANAISLAVALPISSGGSGLSSTSQNFVFVGPSGAAGAPSWRLLTNADLPAIALTSGVSGVLPVINGGTGTTTSTGTGSVVLSTSPTLTGTTSAGILTLTTPLAAANGGTGVTANTGTGNNVLSASPTFTGTVVGAGLTLSTALPVSSGGTGLSSTSQNFNFMGPTSGSGAPLWRLIVNGDLPLIPLTSQVSGTLPVANGGTGLTSTTQNFVFAGPTSGSGAPTWRLLTSGDLPTTSVASPTGVLPVANGGTGVSTATGNGSTVLSVSPTFTGAPVFNVSSMSINATTVGDALVITDTNANNQSTIQFNNGTNAAFFGIKGTTATQANQALIQGPSAGIYITTAGTTTINSATAVNSLTLGAPLPVLSGGTGTTTSTGTGSNVLSNLPTFTGSSSYAAIFSSSGTATDCIQVLNTVAGGTASVACTNNGGNSCFFGQGGTTRGGAFSDQSFIVPSANGLYIAGAIKPTTTIATIYGGTGTTTSTGTGSNVLSTAPTFTGQVTINAGTSLPLVMTTSNALDSVSITSSNTTGQASYKMVNDVGAISVLYLAGSAQVGSGSQTGIFMSGTTGFRIGGNVSMGNTAVANPTHPLTINTSGTANPIYVKSTNSGCYNSIIVENDIGKTAEFGIGGSAVGATQDRNIAYISADALIINCPMIQPVSMHTVITNWQSTGNAYQISTGSYVTYPLGATGAYFFGPSGVTTNYGSLTVNPVVGGAGTTPYWLMPVEGIYSVKWRWTPSPYYNNAAIAKNLSNGNIFVPAAFGDPGLIATNPGYYYVGGGTNPPAGLELGGTFYATTSDQIYLAQQENNLGQNTAQPGNYTSYAWNLTWTLIQRTK